jgi:two-component system phosphate regulon sensor histidine kinase PhoR
MKRRRPYRSSESAKKRLFWTLALFLGALSLPVYLLIARVYAQLENEMYFNARNGAEQWVDSIDRILQAGMQKEQDRPIAEYRFFNVLENPLLQAAGLKFSPLSEVPPKTGIAGLIGYFQIDADGSFHTPALPDIGQEAPPALSAEELAKRQALKAELQNLLAADSVSPDKGQTAKPSSGDEARQQYVVSNLPEPAAKGAAATESKAEAVSGKQLQEWNIDTGQWEKELKKNVYPAKKKADSSVYKTRKEMVKLPEQSLAGSLLNSAQNQVGAAPPAASAPAAVERRAGYAGADPRSARSAKPVIFSFESEVAPLQLLNLPSGHLCFYRQVWHNKSRFIQGFVVDGEAYWRAVVLPLFDGAPYSSVLIADQGRLVQQFEKQGGRPETLLYRSRLLPPFQSVELIVNSAALDAGPGKRVIDLLALSLGLILFGGVAVFYRLGSKQVDLTRQQQNFISAVSHELKTPLTSIRMYGEMLRSGWVDEEAKKKTYYDFIFFESERLSRLIANVLQLAKLENGRMKAELVPIAPELLLQRVKGKIAAQIEASGFQLNSQISETLEDHPVAVEEDAFYQIVINLVDNAIKFASEASDKTIDIGFKTGTGRREIIFYVRDYGPGIKKGQLNKIFTLFYRAGDEMTRTKPGTGIGLALAKQLAAGMNAKLTVENRQPGAEFRIILNVGVKR